MEDIEQQQQPQQSINDGSVSLRVNGEIFRSVLDLGVNLNKVVCVGKLKSIQGDNLIIQIEENEFNEFKRSKYLKINDTIKPSETTTYQFSINCKDKTIEYIHNFGEKFDAYAYQTTFYNYFYILKDRFPQLKGEQPMDQ